MTSLPVPLADRLAPSRTAIVLSWPTTSGRLYPLKGAAELGDANGWQIRANNVPGNGSVCEFEYTISPDTNRFYRVQSYAP